MNQPSLEKYAPRVAAGGVLVFNMLTDGPRPVYPNLRVIAVPATAEAERLGFAQGANLVLLGALLAAVPVLPLEAVERALEAHLPAHHGDKLEVNRLALRRGASLAVEGPLGVGA